MLVVDKVYGDSYWLTGDGLSEALHYEDVVRLALGASWEGQLAQVSDDYMSRLVPLTAEDIDEILVSQGATDFERILAQFIYLVREQDEPCCYGKATNTSVIGYIEDEDENVKIEIYTNDGASKAVFVARYNQNVFDPENPYWAIFEKTDCDAGYYDDWGWEYRGAVDDTETAKYYEV